MSDPQINAALAEVQGIVRAAGVARDGVHVLSCDADVAAVSRVRNASEVTVAGRGGTDMRVAAENLTPRPDAIVVLTDGYTPWPSPATWARLVIALIGNNITDQHCPTWARTVTVGGTAG